MKGTGARGRTPKSVREECGMILTESEEQKNLFLWAKLSAGAHPELRLMYHIPNEGKRSIAAGARMKQEGLKAGVPDICLPVARQGCHGLYIELKRQKGGRVEKHQLEWMKALKNEGYFVAVCRGWEEASELIQAYLKAGVEANERTL